MLPRAHTKWLWKLLKDISGSGSEASTQTCMGVYTCFLSANSLRASTLRAGGGNSTLLHPSLLVGPTTLQIPAMPLVNGYNPVVCLNLFISTALFYYVLGNLHPKLRSTLRCIQLIAAVTYPNLIKYGFKKVLQPFIEDAKKLSDVR